MSYTLPNGSTNVAAAAAAKQDKAAETATDITNETVRPHQRKQRLIKASPGANPLKFKAWIVGHSVALVFGTIALTFQLLRLPNRYYINSICYRLSLLGSIAALMATFSHKFGLHFMPPSSTLIAQQNFQYLVLAVAWVFTFKSIYKIIPFYVISVLQVAAFREFAPVIKQADIFAAIIAYDELILILYLLVRTLLFRNTSGYQLLLFLLFYWLRILYNKETGNLFRAIVDRVDGRVSSIKNPNVQHAWLRTKEFLSEKQKLD